MVCIGQIQQKQYKENNFNGFQTHVDYNGKVYDWEMVGNKCYNCASFYIKTMRSTNDENGYYTYYIFLFSNSYDKYGYLTNTYLKQVNIYSNAMNEKISHIYQTDYVLIKKKDEKTNFDGVEIFFTFKSFDAFEKITMTWQDLIIM